MMVASKIAIWSFLGLCDACLYGCIMAVFGVVICLFLFF